MSHPSCSPFGWRFGHCLRGRVGSYLLINAGVSLMDGAVHRAFRRGVKPPDYLLRGLAVLQRLHTRIERDIEQLRRECVFFCPLYRRTEFEREL